MVHLCLGFSVSLSSVFVSLFVFWSSTLVSVSSLLLIASDSLDHTCCLRLFGDLLGFFGWGLRVYVKPPWWKMNPILTWHDWNITVYQLTNLSVPNPGISSDLSLITFFLHCIVTFAHLNLIPLYFIFLKKNGIVLKIEEFVIVSGSGSGDQTDMTYIILWYLNPIISAPNTCCWKHKKRYLLLLITIYLRTCKNYN